jgi:hypothetical protein
MIQICTHCRPDCRSELFQICYLNNYISVISIPEEVLRKSVNNERCPAAEECYSDGCHEDVGATTTLVGNLWGAWRAEKRKEDHQNYIQHSRKRRRIVDTAGKLHKNNYLFDKKKGKLFFTFFFSAKKIKQLFLAREQKKGGKKFFLFIGHEVLFYGTPFLHCARRNYVCGAIRKQSEEVSSSGGSSLEFWD